MFGLIVFFIVLFAFLLFSSWMNLYAILRFVPLSRYSTTTRVGLSFSLSLCLSIGWLLYIHKLPDRSAIILYGGVTAIAGAAIYFRHRQLRARQLPFLIIIGVLGCIATHFLLALLEMLSASFLKFSLW